MAAELHSRLSYNVCTLMTIAWAICRRFGASLFFPATIKCIISQQRRIAVGFAGRKSMFTTTFRTLVSVLTVAGCAQAAVITLENTIPSGNLFLQPPVLTGAAPLFGAGNGVVVANGFTAPVSAMLSQVSIVVEYQDFPFIGVTGRSPMLLTLFTDNGNSPGTPIESWTVPLAASTTSLAVVTVDSNTHASLVAGQQYWLSEVPTDPVHTGIGWGLASSGFPGILLPVTGTNTGVNSGWGPTQLNLANEFSVVGTTAGTTVPEPATFGLNALVLLSIMAGLRYRLNNSKKRSPPVTVNPQSVLPC